MLDLLKITLAIEIVAQSGDAKILVGVLRGGSPDDVNNNSLK